VRGVIWVTYTSPPRKGFSLSVSPGIDVHEVEYRERLQGALGADYELRDLIGRGGFGAVYAAWDPKLEREVAVKALRHDLFPTRLVLERFQREAKSVAKLRHPHILPVYSVGDGDGLAFMVMPYIKGESLAARLKRGPVGVDEAMRITIEIARALDAAHRVGIIHRDVKPENILLDGDEPIALLADFGVAKVAEGDGSITGTEMLAGRRPYEADSYQQLIVLQFTSEPPPLREAAPGVPQPIADVVMRSREIPPGAGHPRASLRER
jgi:serine/threonine protein kinase